MTPEERDKLFLNQATFPNPEERTAWLQSLKPGDEVIRLLAGKIPIRLKVTMVLPDIIGCGPYVFSRRNGAELDEVIPFTEEFTGSWIVPVEPAPRTGDDASVGEELLEGVDPLEEKCGAVALAVKAGIFTLESALLIYRVTKEQYEAYERSK